MKKFILKSISYVILIIVSLELLVRVFHLYTEVPVRYIDEFKVEKSLPNQTGFAVTGNRRQNFSEYHINNFGFNSFREFNPSENKTEIAIVGDSFIEGMHQNYYNSTGKKVEEKLNNIEVYEYGYAGYDLANQLYLIQAYKSHFEKIDYIIIYLKCEEDLERAEYLPDYERIALLKSPLFKIRDEFKLLSYASAVGIVDPIKNLAIKIINRDNKNAQTKKTSTKEKNIERLENFKTLINTFGFNKNKMAFLLNRNTTSPVFLEYCDENGFEIIDYGSAFKSSKKTPTLIYDQHWNNHGRNLIASEIASFLKHKL